MQKFNYSGKLLLINAFILFFTNNLNSQTEGNFVQGVLVDYDKCGYYYDDEKNFFTASINNWGYSYDSLLADIEMWRLNPYVKIDSIGLSVQGRPLWQLTITEDPDDISEKRTVFIHARTHPNEVQAFWVTEEIINILLSESSVAQTIRANCVFYIIPMYNPDGVELGYPRENANGVDIESNWNKFPHQPEVAALKARFTNLMQSSAPIEIALNMHSAYACKRYFVFHDSGGTSPAFTLMEQDFIEGIRSYYPNGIEPWSYYVSWVSSTPLQYPESWFWINHGEKVMALTYEDMNCSSAGNYDLTANAIIQGIKDYMGLVTSVDDFADFVPEEFKLFQNYPNPFNPVTRIRYQVSNVSDVVLKVIDVLGKEIAILVNEEKRAGNYEVEFDANQLSSGIYFYQILTNDFSQTKKMTLVR